MHKEVNRSLIKWPAAASATMLAVSWFPMGDEMDRVVPPAATQVNVEQRIAAVLETDVVIPQPEFDQADHREHAAGVMKLPLRIGKRRSQSLPRQGLYERRRYEWSRMNWPALISRQQQAVRTPGHRIRQWGIRQIGTLQIRIRQIRILMPG